MRKLKKVLGSLLLVCGMCLFSTVSVSAADVEMKMNTTASANAGDTVYAQIVLNGNPGISTLGVRMPYDDEVLTYEGETWHSDISSNSRNMSLVSNIEENGKQILNISTILDSTYKTSGEAIVTVKFTAKQSFSSMPVELEARDVTDADYANVTVKISNGTISGNTSGSNNENNNSSESDTKDSESETKDSENQSESESSEKDNSSESKDNSANNDSGKTNSGNNNSGKTNSGNSNLDQTFKTGAVDVRVVLGVIAVVLVGVAAVCIKVLRKREC